MSRERDGLLRQRESNEASIDRLQGELERRDENSMVELRLLTEKHEQACTQLRARDYENKQASAAAGGREMGFSCVSSHTLVCWSSYSFFELFRVS